MTPLKSVYIKEQIFLLRFKIVVNVNQLFLSLINLTSESFHLKVFY